MELDLILFVDSAGRGTEIVRTTFTESDLEEAMQRWLDDRFPGTVLQSLEVDSLTP